MLIEGADRPEACHWARSGMVIGGADEPEACHWARFGMLIGGADRHEACAMALGLGVWSLGSRRAKGHQ